MDRVLFGEDPFKIQQVMNVFRRSPSYSILSRHWETFANNLEIEPVMLEQLRLDLNLGKIELQDIPHEILTYWKSCQGVEATLQVLYDALVETKLQDVADSLKDKFCHTFILKLDVQGQILDLEGVLEKPIPVDQIEYITSWLSKNQDMSKPIQLIKKKMLPSAKPPYYISRSFFSRTLLRKEIFTDESTKDHIFLLKDISLSELEKLAGDQDIQMSSTQLHEVTAKFILLELDEDFDRIRRITTKPVHLIKYLENGSYFLCKTNAGFAGIRTFLSVDVLSWEEEKFLSSMKNLPAPLSVCIADTAGMGKTLSLSKMAEEIKLCSPNHIVLFISLSEFVHQTKCRITSCEALMKAIAEFSCCDANVNFLLEAILLDASQNLDLFFDGYDEVIHDEMELADRILKFAKQIKKVRLFVTSRPHFKHHLESVLDTIAFEIFPFTDSNQRDFLTKFWSTHEEFKAQPGETLKQFAKECLQLLQAKLTDKEMEIAGVPLQCWILAEVLAEDAQRSAKLSIANRFVLEVNSIFDMYKALVKFKFNRLRQVYNRLGEKGGKYRVFKRKYVNAHIHDSIQLLFKDYVGKLEKHLIGCEDAQKNIIYSIGLIEESPHQNTPRFVHRTFAEYFLAKFLVQNFRNCGVTLELIFGLILGGNGLRKVQPMLNTNNEAPFPTHFELNYPVVAYFLEKHLRSYLQDHCIDPLLISRYLGQTLPDKETLCMTLVACCSNDLENWFDVTKDIIACFSKVAWKDVELRDKYFKLLALITMNWSSSNKFIRNVLKFVTNVVGISISQQKYIPAQPDCSTNLATNLNHTYFHYETYTFMKRVIPGSGSDLDPNRSYFLLENDEFYKYPWIKDATPLHVAVFKGSYDVVRQLVQEIGDDIRYQKCLVHLCVQNSQSNSEIIITQKEAILELLSKQVDKHDMDWFNEKVEHDMTPLLISSIHLTLAKCLVRYGADINAYSEQKGTVLHSLGNARQATEKVKWAVHNCFTKINHTDRKGYSPLQRAILAWPDCIDYEILELLCDANADFNHVCFTGLPVLFTAFRNNNLQLLDKLVTFGANVNFVCRHGNAAHVLFTNNVDMLPSAAKKVSILQWLFNQGFNGINKYNHDDLTPLHLAMGYEDLTKEIVDIFYANGADFNSKDGNGESVLDHAIRNKQSEELIRKIIEYKLEAIRK